MARDDTLNPKIDVIFRKLFGSEENKDLLISLLNSVVEPDPPIVDVTIKNPYNLATYHGSKESILDIRAVDQDGTWYDVEMQVEAHIFYGRRAIYYLSKTYADQLETGEGYSSLNTVIGIHFLDFEYFDDDRVLRQFVFQDMETHRAPSELDCVRLYFIEMPKFNKDWPEIRTALDRWVAFLNRAQDLNPAALPAPLAHDPDVTRAVTELKRAGLNPQERDIYEGEVKRRMVDAVQLRTAEERGVQQGLQQGMQIGMQQGLQQGVRYAVVRQMTRRFGEVPAQIEAKLQKLSVETLDDLSFALPDFASYEDVEQWLGSD